jgi:LmbE family N-acetylglucosaminyl deacetylase
MNHTHSDKVVLAIGAHPDDIEFAAGATMAMLSSQGARLYFVVCTDGNRGSRQRSFEKAELVASRKQEQQQASTILGATETTFLDDEDGNLQADLQFKEKIVRIVRRVKPDMIFTHDPSWYYSIREDGNASVNHTDHRACGEAVIDAVYPLARDLQSFPDHALEGLLPHITPELYLFNWDKPNFAFDVTGFVETKLAAIAAHNTQIDDLAMLTARFTTRHQKLGQQFGYTHAEGFTRLVFS